MSDTMFYTLLAVAVVLVTAMIVAVIVLGVRVVRVARELRRFSSEGRVAFWSALIYTIFPIDLLPDPIYLDDIGVLGGTLIYLTRLANRAREQRAMPPLQQRRPARSRR